ncbi:putative bifunctional diguanylate cyclase/phosphodiesterase [Ovoidimarina sediminis]|uniref:putative bifunctional diguanylate cyclase/phosphodiesterase n=1 Tax=Ovoidimarina sediminis TaxID=3079856 RepID=UPI00290A9811|nr:EAL domain-containing protein [Rhodophyticola sp. MJ-SS7]MDU8942562.1 EAL domain-containing protein [Rhodophyticola sp. MJ-SS7]
MISFRSLKLRHAAAVIALLAISLAVYTAIWAKLLTDRLWLFFEAETALVVDTVEPTLAAAAWNFEESWIDHVLVGLDRSKTWEFARVDVEGLVVERARANDWQPEWNILIGQLQSLIRSGEARGMNFLDTESFRLVSRPIQFDGETIGWFYAGFSRAVIEDSIDEAYETALVLGLTTTLVLSACVFIITGRIVEPLVRVAGMIRQVTRGETAFPVSDTDRSDEVGDIARAVVAFKDSAQKMRELAASEAAARKQAEASRIDPLTGVPNRVSLDEAGDDLAFLTPDGLQGVAFALIDLDGFKPINDTFGHRAGDRFLIEIARRLREVVRESDLLVRLGGDEFGILFWNLRTRSQALRMAERITEVFEKPVDIGDREVSAQGSIGLARAIDVSARIDDLAAAADAAMYSFKRKSGTAFSIYDPVRMKARGINLNEKEELLQDIAQGNLAVFFQPKIEIATGEICGFEALARRCKPDGTIGTPGDFMPQIEAFGLQAEFNRAIFSTVLEQVRQWVDSGLDPGRVAINIDEQSLATREGREEIELLIAGHSGLARYITIEITEDIFINRGIEIIRDAIDRFEKLGLRISMDDFGTGYGSFRHLKEFPVHEMKIDTQFTAGIGKDKSAEVIIDGFLSIAAGLGADVVAEGVETPGQLAFLAERGCQYAQGFHFSPPLHPDDATRFLKAGEPGRFHLAG